MGDGGQDKPSGTRRGFTSQEIEGRYPRERHEEFMRRAIANGRKAAIEYATGGMFGAVVVKESRVVADGINRVVSLHDPTCHGEIDAIRNASSLLKTFDLQGCLLYTSGEPCPMCLAASYWANMDGIVYASTVADAERYGDFDDSFIYQEFAKPLDRRLIPQIQMLREEAVAVWKEYVAKPDKVPY